MAGFGPASLPHLALVLDTQAPGGSAKAPASLPSLGLVMYDAGVFCTLAGTLDAVTSSSEGTVSVSGTLAKTLADVSLSSVVAGGGAGGEVGAAAPLPHLAFLFESIAGIVGQTNATLEALTSVSEGDVPGNEIWPYEYDDKPARAPLYWPHARNVDWFQTDTVLRASTGGSFGVVGQTLLPLTVVSASGAVVAGTLANSLDALTRSSAGVVTVSGTLGKTLGAVTCSSAGFVVGDFVGTLSQTLDALSVSSAGSGEAGGVANITLGSLTSVSAGTVSVEGALAKTLQGINANIDGSVLSGYVAVVNNFLESLGCRAEGNNGVRTDKGKSKKGRKSRDDQKFVVEIDGTDFVVETEEQAQTLLENAKTIYEEQVVEVETKAAKKVVAKPLPMPRIRASGPKGPELDALIKEVAELRNEIRALHERAVVAQKQAIDDDEEAIALLL